MGRILSLPAAASTNLISDTLTNTLGNASANVREYTTVSAPPAALSNFVWASDTFSSAVFFTRNSQAEQYITSSSYGVLQDELSDYSYIQARGRNTSTGSYENLAAVYDVNLNPVYSWNQSSPPFSGSLFCVRLHNSNLYFFSTVSSSGIRVTKIALPSGTKTTFSYTGVAQNWDPSASLVFNWPVNNKFWMFLSSSSTYVATYATFDLTTETFAQFGTTRTGSATDYFVDSNVMHVKADGSAVSATVRRSGSATSYGVFSATTSASTYTVFSASAHYLNPYNSSNLQWYSKSDSNSWIGIVTTDAALNSPSIIYDSSSGTYYNSAIAHLQGGDTAVQVLSLNGNSVGLPQYNHPFSNSPTPNISTSVRNQAFFNLASGLGGTGKYTISRNGTTLVIGSKNSSAYGSFLASKLPESIKVRSVYTNLNSSSHFASLSSLIVWENNTSVQYDYATVGGIDGHNRFHQYLSFDPWYTSFATSSGRFFAIPLAIMSGYGSQATVNAITTTIPVYTPSKTAKYKITVIGGGGGTSGVHGTSSSFSTFLAASNGINRAGFNAGCQVVVSGSAVNTGGKGVGADEWGRGEDAGAANSYGGGSGYIAISTATLTAGTTYVYRAGLAPQYGKQGAVLIQEVT